jgi:mannose-6-phosphate isomerase
MKLRTRYVEKPWGRTQLPRLFAPTLGRRIGEVWFVGDQPLPLLAKYLFTSERVSIQVHPGDQEARRCGYTGGKSECWYILDAEPGATIGLGLSHHVSRDELRNSALDGSIESLVDWRPVKRGDFFYVAPGTIHAIGGGISLLEFEQNSDVTYRLFDYGRGRVLHVDAAAAVADRGPFPDDLHHHISRNDEQTLVDGPQFTLVHCNRDRLQDRRRWILPLDGLVRSGTESAGAGECLLLQAEEELDSIDGRVLIGAAASAQSSAVRVGNDIFPAVAHRRAAGAAAVASRGRA